MSDYAYCCCRYTYAGCTNCKQAHHAGCTHEMLPVMSNVHRKVAQALAEGTPLLAALR